MFVAEAALSALIPSLLQALRSDDFLKSAHHEDAYSEVERIQKLLQTVEVFLVDAEEKQLGHDGIRFWMDDLQNSAFDLEDMLDEFSAQRLQEEKKELDVPAVKFESEFKLKNKMLGLVNRLEASCGDIEEFGLQQSVTGETSAATKQVWVQHEGTSMVRESASVIDDYSIVGREEEKKKLIDLVLKSASSKREKPHVSSVVGPSAIGKTTVAELVYNDATVRKHFDSRIWIYVSHQFEFQEIMETILKRVGGIISGNETLEAILGKLQEMICCKKLLLVLDDIWERDATLWEKVQNLFRETEVILTTDLYEVAAAWGSMPDEILVLEKLNNEDSWSIFQQHALDNRDTSNQMLEALRPQIVWEFDGLPLTAKVLGSLFRKTDEREWERILQSRFWAMRENLHGLLPTLGLSYHHLPACLKRCFIFCSIFPKNYEFEEQEIVLMWTGQRFLQHSEHQMEDVGREYFQNLLSRAFFQRSPNNTSLYVMHDLIHGLAQWAAGETCFQLQRPINYTDIQELINRARYACIPNHWDNMKKVQVIHEGTKLRALLYHILEKCGVREPVHVHKLLSVSSFVRVLSLKKCSFTEVPNSIGNLNLLRYLDLSQTKIQVLSKSICKLVNLQSLLLKDCFKLKELPENLGNLVNLRHLDFNGACQITKLPKALGNLRFLQTLPAFFVDKEIGHGIQELKCMPLRDSICISELQNVNSFLDAKEARLDLKSRLDILELKWGKPDDNLMLKKIAEDVIESLQPTQNLKKLVIDGYYGIRCPTWLKDPQFSKMMSLALVSCENCTYLPPLGKLPLLQHLHIEALNGITNVGPEFDGEDCLATFPLLEHLSFENMKRWKDWMPRAADQVCVFPSLKELCLNGCPELLGNLPNHLPQLEQLVIWNCGGLTALIPNTGKLQKLDIQKCRKVECNNLINLSLLNHLILDDIEEFDVTREGFCQQVTELKELRIGDQRVMHLWHNEAMLLQHLTSVTDLSLSDCSQFEQLPNIHGKLQVKNCSVHRLPRVLHSMSPLFRLKVESCQELIQFPDELSFTDDVDDNALKLSVVIDTCGALQYVPMTMMYNRTFLVGMSIRNCRSLTVITRVHLPLTLNCLDIYGCTTLESLVEVDIRNDCPVPLLYYLRVKKCPSLKYLASSTRGKLPFKVKILDISDCDNLTSLLSSPSSSSSRLELPAELESLSIKSCPKLETVAESLQHNPICVLKRIVLWDCDSLDQFLPSELHHHLSHLEHFEIIRCEKLEVINVNNFPSLTKLKICNSPAVVSSILNEGFRIINNNLRRLEISYPKRSTCAKPMSDWGLERLFSLTTLSIYGEEASDLVSFLPEKKPALPSSLTELTLWDFPNLKYMTREVFQNLDSLTELWLWECPELESFPKEGFPRSLFELHIHKCPLFQKCCQKKKGREWSKIAHVPVIKISNDGEQVETIINVT